MFSLIGLALTSFIQFAEASTPQMSPSPKDLIPPEEVTTPCEIPLYVNIAGVPEDLYPIYTRAIYDAAVAWNSAHAGFWFRVHDWSYEADRKDGAVTVVYTEIDPVYNRIIGYTHRLPAQGYLTTQRARVQINNTDPYCMSPGQTGCYEMFNVVLHELGHALGLPHSEASEAVMTLNVNANEPRRTLSLEDISAIRERFPLDGSGCSGGEEGFAWSKRL